MFLEEYARKMIAEEEMHPGEVNKMLRKPGEIERFKAAGVKSVSVRSPTVSEDNLAQQALAYARASDTNEFRESRFLRQS